MGSSSIMELPTIAGNFFNRYECVNTVSPEANDPWFVKNAASFETGDTRLNKLRYLRGGISASLGAVSPAALVLVTRNQSTAPEYQLLDRSYLFGTMKNKTRINTRFSSPGGFETLSRGFLDPEHETFSVYNAMTFRNLNIRDVHNTHMQAHCGQFGVSAHSTTTARVYGQEPGGAPEAGAVHANEDPNEIYTITGHAAAHKIHRNNVEKVQLSSPTQPAGTTSALTHDYLDMLIVTSSVYDNAFVSHMIPRTDNQTRWITASLI